MSTLRNMGLLYMRNLRQAPRIPVVLVFGIVMPVIQLLLFGSLFESITKLPAFQQAWPDVNYRAYIAHAIILLTTFLGMANASAALLVDLRTGYFDKLYCPRHWSPPATTLNFSIGQGEITQTMINMMKFYEGLASEGRSSTPYIVRIWSRLAKLPRVVR